MVPSSTLNAIPNPPPGNSINSSKPPPGSRETVAMPVAMLLIVPPSRGASLGANRSRACTMPANALSNIAFRFSDCTADLTIHDFTGALLERAQVVDDVPGQFLPITREFDAGEQFRG